MIMCATPVFTINQRNLPGHPEMNAEPMCFAENSTHLLAMPKDSVQPLADQTLAKGRHIHLPKNPFPSVHPDIADTLTQRRQPALTVIFDFGEFWH